MTVISVTPDFAIAAGVGAGDVPALVDRGVSTVIAVAPDTDGVAESEQVAARARQAGLKFSYVPVVIGLIGRDEIAAFSRALDAAAGPVLAYCHSGLRAVLMWALARQDALGRETVVDLARRAGFEIAAYLDDDSEALMAA